MSTIEDVTRSFKASLALASRGVIDLSKNRQPETKSKAKKAGQSFLLARPMVKESVEVNDLRQFCRRVWNLEKGFIIRKRTHDRFTIGFDLRHDRNKVLRGGPWIYKKEPIILQLYDGFSPVDSVKLSSLFYWVNVTNIPTKFETPDWIKDVATVAGAYLGKDEPLFSRTGEVRVHVEHEITEPFLLKKCLHFEDGIEAEVSFDFEHLTALCKHCNRIYHEGDLCPLMGSSAVNSGAASRKGAPPPGFGSPVFSTGTFQFQGSVPAASPPVSRSLFMPEGSKARKPVILKPVVAPPSQEYSNMQLVCIGGSSSGVVENNVGVPLSSDILAQGSSSGKVENNVVVPLGADNLAQGSYSSCEPDDMVDLQLVSLFQETENNSMQLAVGQTAFKRALIPSCDRSPSKLLVPLPALFQRPLDEGPTKKLKIPTFPVQVTAKSLGMHEVSGGILVPTVASKALKGKGKAKAGVKKEKKKRGRPVGSKNKVKTPVKMTAEEAVAFLCPPKPPSPSVKGKEVEKSV